MPGHPSPPACWPATHCRPLRRGNCWVRRAQALLSCTVQRSQAAWEARSVALALSPREDCLIRIPLSSATTWLPCIGCTWVHPKEGGPGGGQKNVLFLTSPLDQRLPPWHPCLGCTWRGPRWQAWEDDFLTVLGLQGRCIPGCTRHNLPRMPKRIALVVPRSYIYFKYFTSDPPWIFWKKVNYKCHQSNTYNMSNKVWVQWYL